MTEMTSSSSAVLALVRSITEVDLYRTMISLLGIVNCSVEHQSMDWRQSHKSECRSSDFKKKIRMVIERTDPSLPLVSVIPPLPREVGDLEGGRVYKLCKPN